MKTTNCLLFLGFVMIIGFLSTCILSAQTWYTVNVGEFNDWSPMVQVDEDGYVHFGNQDSLSTTHAQDPNMVGNGTLVHFSTVVPPTGYDAYFPALTVKNLTPHLCYRKSTAIGTKFQVAYWNPSLESVDIYMDDAYHGHYPSIQISSDETIHIFYQMDDSEHGNIYYQNSNSEDTYEVMYMGFDGASTLYSYATAIDNNDDLHWIGSLYKYEDGHGKNLYYNKSISGVFDSVPELLNGADGYFPSITVDDSGKVHAVWEIDDILYCTRDSSGWSEPEIISDVGVYEEYYLHYFQIMHGDFHAFDPLEGKMNIAWAVSEGGIWRTTNYWNQYETQYVNNSRSINGVHAIDSLHVYCVGDSGKFWHTSNSGVHVPLVGDGWYEDSTDITINLRDCWFSDTLTGFAVGDSGTIIKTVDGGENWSSITSNITVDLKKIDFPAADTGYIAADLGTVLITTDGGDTWDSLSIGTSNKLLGMHVLSSDTVWVVGENSEVRVTYNAGSSWTQKNTSVSSYIDDVYGVYFVNGNLGYLVGNKKSSVYYFCKTTDGGSSWMGDSPVNGNGVWNPMHDVYAENEDKVYICGTDGMIFHGNMRTNARYNRSGIAIDENGYAHVAYCSIASNFIYYVNNIGGSWNSPQIIGSTKYLEQIDGNSIIGLDFKTSTIYIGARDASGNGYLIFTNDINLLAPIFKDRTSKIIASADLSEPSEITENEKDSLNSLEVFDFKLVDVANDGLPTKVTQLNIWKGADCDSDVSFLEYFAGAVLNFESTDISYDSINNERISFGDGASLLISIPEGDTVTFTLSVWLDTLSVLRDGSNIDFKISAAHDVYLDTTGSSLMTTDPVDINSGAIQVTLIPSRFIFTNLPEGIIPNMDYSFADDFYVSIANYAGAVVQSSSCSDLVITALATDSVSAINGSVTVTPSGAQSTINGTATYTKLEFTEGHQYVLLKATGTVDATPMTSYSDFIPIFPVASQALLRNSSDCSDPFDLISSSIRRLGYEIDVIDACNQAVTLPDSFLIDYDIVWVDEKNAIYADSVALIYFINNSSVLDNKAIGMFGCMKYGMSGLPKNGGIMRNFGIGQYQMVPTFSNAMETTYITGVDDNPISDNLSVQCNSTMMYSFLTQTFPFIDSTNVQIVLEANMSTQYDFPVPIAISHHGTNYKTFRSGFYIDEYGDATDIDTLLSRLVNWFEAPDTDTLGYTPYFTNRLTDPYNDTEFINENQLFSYTANCDDPDLSGNLTIEPVVLPSFLTPSYGTNNVTLEGTPLIQHSGDTIIVLKVYDGKGNFIPQYSQLYIQHINNNPEIDGPANDTAFVDQAYNLQLVVTDADTVIGDEIQTTTMTFASEAWVQYDDANYIISGTPGAGDIGTTNVQIQAFDFNGGWATYDLAIEVIDANGAFIVVSDESISISLEQENTGTDTLIIENTGDINLNWNTTEDISWLSLSVLSGAITPGNTEEVVFDFDASGLSADTYQDTIIINSNAVNEAALEIAIELLVTSPGDPVINVLTNSLNYELNIDDDITDSLVIQNTGSGDLGWSVSNNSAWLVPGPNQDTIPGGESRYMVFTIDASGLNTDTYHDTLVINSNAVNEASLEIAVELVVTSSPSSDPVIEVLTSTLNYELNVDEETTDSLEIQNTGSGDLEWSATNDSTWLTLDTNQETIPGGQSRYLVFTIDATGLNVGNYVDSITIESNDPLNQFTKIPVTLDVTEETTSIELIQRENIMVYPIPFTDKLSIKFGKKGINKCKVMLYDANGNLIDAVTISYLGDEVLNLEFRNTDAGVYFLKFIFDDEIIIKKVMKVK